MEETPKKVLSRAIFMAIKDFENSTGVIVHDIEVRRLPVIELGGYSDGSKIDRFVFNLS